MFDRCDNLLDAPPLVGVLSFSTNDVKTLKDIDDVVDAPSLYLELARALVKIQEVVAVPSVEKEEAAAQFSQRFLLSVVGWSNGVPNSCKEFLNY